jgi:hypothetical protein
VPLGKQIASRHLAVAAHLLPLGLQLLLAALTVHLKLLTVRHAVVDAVDAAIGHAGLTFDTLRPGLLTLHPRLALNALRPGLLTLHPRLALNALRPGLLTLHPRLALDALRPRLLTLHPRLTLGALRPRLATLRTLGELLALNARSALHPLLAALRPLDALVPAVTIDLRGLPILAATIVRPRIRRGRDRQRGDAGCEKNPGHKLSPSNGINGPFAAPFQRLNGWNLQVTALA